MFSTLPPWRSSGKKTDKTVKPTRERVGFLYQIPLKSLFIFDRFKSVTFSVARSVRSMHCRVAPINVSAPGFHCRRGLSSPALPAAKAGL